MVRALSHARQFRSGACRRRRLVHDVYFYSIDWDAREDVKRIDTNRCKVALLTGEYDYSCTPQMSEAVAAAIPGSRLTIMMGMGHFPMIENYPAFRPHLLAALEHVAG